MGASGRSLRRASSPSSSSRRCSASARASGWRSCGPMTSTPSRALGLDALAEVSEAVESGAGLPEVARAAGRAIESSVIVLDASSSVLAVACASPDDERAVMAGESGAQAVERRVADTPVGELRYRPRGEPEPALLRLVANLIAL